MLVTISFLRDRWQHTVNDTHFKLEWMDIPRPSASLDSDYWATTREIFTFRRPLGRSRGWIDAKSQTKNTFQPEIPSPKLTRQGRYRYPNPQKNWTGSRHWGRTWRDTISTGCHQFCFRWYRLSDHRLALVVRPACQWTSSCSINTIWNKTIEIRRQYPYLSLVELSYREAFPEAPSTTRWIGLQTKSLRRYSPREPMLGKEFECFQSDCATLVPSHSIELSAGAYLANCTALKFNGLFWKRGGAQR